MKKSLLVLAIVALTFSLAFVTTSIAQDKGPAEMTLETADSAKPKPATFNHAKHQEKYACDICHHKEMDGAKVPCTDDDTIAKCTSCHNADFGTEKLKTFKDVAHKQCKGCHTKEKETGAPTKCAGCHPKK